MVSVSEERSLFGVKDYYGWQRVEHLGVALHSPSVDVCFRIDRRVGGQLEERMRLAALWQDQGLVFPNETGSLFNPSNLRNRSFKRIKTRSGVREDLRFHDLRHTCATLLLREGVNVKVVSEMFGHASIPITLKTNSHALPDMQDSAAEAMEAALGTMS